MDNEREENDFAVWTGKFVTTAGHHSYTVLYDFVEGGGGEISYFPTSPLFLSSWKSSVSFMCSMMMTRRVARARARAALRGCGTV